MARIAIAAVVGAAWVHAARAEDPPRYRLDVGQEIVYTTTSEYRYRFLLGVASETLRRSAETRIRVVRKNADGSARLFVKHTDTREDEEPEIEFGWCDVQPDGRFVLGPTLGSNFDASAIFKPLPPPDAREWQTRGGHGERLRLRIADDGAVGETVESGQLTVGGATCTSRCVLRGDGLPERIEMVWAKADPAQGRRTTTTVLVESVRGDPAAAATLDRELMSYAEALDRWTLERLRAADEAAFLAALERGRERLRALRKDVKSPELRGELDRCLVGGAEAREAIVAQWRECAAWCGKQAPGWKLEDLDGRRRALGDYSGKIVVLDFWFADCYWCLRAMPALRDLAARHAGKVAVLGMNKDSNPEEARQVVAAMELNYPTLRAREAIGPYEVSGFPTTFVLDGKGVVRRVFVGYGSTFGVELETTVEDLLREG